MDNLKLRTVPAVQVVKIEKCTTTIVLRNGDSKPVRCLGLVDTLRVHHLSAFLAAEPEPIRFDYLRSFDNSVARVPDS